MKTKLLFIVLTSLLCFQAKKLDLIRSWASSMIWN